MEYDIIYSTSIFQWPPSTLVTLSPSVKRRERIDRDKAAAFGQGATAGESSGRPGPLCHIKPLSIVYIRVCKCCKLMRLEEEINDCICVQVVNLFFFKCTQRGTDGSVNMKTKKKISAKKYPHLPHVVLKPICIFCGTQN